MRERGEKLEGHEPVVVINGRHCTHSVAEHIRKIEPSYHGLPDLCSWCSLVDKSPVCSIW